MKNVGVAANDSQGRSVRNPGTRAGVRAAHWFGDVAPQGATT